VKTFRMSSLGIKFLEKEEGCILHVYKDQAGKDTIGIGHLITKEEKERGSVVIAGIPISLSKKITQEQAESLLAQDLNTYEEVISSSVKVALMQYQIDALISFAFNIGVFGFTTSTLLKELNKYQYEKVPEEMKKWKKGTVNGKKVVLPVLVGRRKREGKLWISGEY